MDIPVNRSTPTLYTPLDPDRRQIRVVKLQTDPGPVICTLKVVSLDDWEDDFSELHGPFEENWIDGRTALWLNSAFASGSSPTSTSPRIPFPSWRWKNCLPDWDSLAHAFGVGSAVPDPRNNIQQLPLLRAIDVVEQRPDSTLLIRPRFKWGDFEAISYRCGSEEKVAQISVNGVLQPVTQNLHDVLCQLRSLPETSHVYFWVDALCIAQEDILEKNQQVNFMREIFSHALAVVAYMGNATSRTHQAVDTIVQGYYLGTTTSQGMESKLRRSQSTWASGLPWAAILELLGSRYFERLWIVQELALNTRMTLLLCGERIMTRQMVRMMARVARDIPQDIWDVIKADVQPQVDERETIPVRSAQHVFELAERVESILRLSSYPSSERSAYPYGITQVLDLAQKAKCKYSRDKVFGLAALLDARFPIITVVDYSKSREQVYNEFAAKLFAEYGLRYVLSWCSSGSKHDLRSWVPNWDVQFPRNHVRLLDRYASADIVHQPVISDNMTLDCRGIVVDQITGLSEKPSDLLQYTEEVSRETSSPSVSHRINRYGSKDAIEHALFHTMMMNHVNKVYLRNFHADNPDNHSANPTTLLGNINWVAWDVLKSRPDWRDTWIDNWSRGLAALTRSQTWEAFDRIRQSNAEFDLWGYSLKSFFPEIEAYKSIPDDPTPEKWLSDEEVRRLTQNLTLAGLTMKGRRLATTKTGWLALLPEYAQEGDITAVLFGCSFPVVLRPVEGCNFEYIGEAYVHGLMDGEAIDLLQQGELREQSIVLC